MDAALRKHWMMAEQDERISEAIDRDKTRLRNFIRRRVADPSDAEDILQEVFYELVETYRLMKPIEQVGAWLLPLPSLTAANPHESGGMAGPAGERPPSSNAIATRNGFSQADRAGGAGDECAGIGKPITPDGFGKVAGDAAHAAAICHNPADRAIDRRCRFDHAHELQRR